MATGIEARATCTKNANYKKDGKPFGRQIVRYYNISSATMEAIALHATKIKTFLDKNLMVQAIYPEIVNDPTVTEWKEDPWKVDW